MRTLLRHQASQRAGLSIVEVLVALVLVAIGMMGVAGSTAIAFRTTLDAARRREAAQRASSRIAQIAASGCALAMAGASTDSARQVSEQWSVSMPVNGFALVTDSVTWTGTRGKSSLALTSALTC